MFYTEKERRDLPPLDKTAVVARFLGRFGRLPRWIVSAPGRVNLIGEHTDYNDGFVLPMAIDRAAWIALRPRDDRRVEVFSVNFNQSAAFSLDELHNDNAGWIEYLKGVAWSLQAAGHRLTGWEGVLVGDVPVGAGLSSSAALEMAVARAFHIAADLQWNPITTAKLAQAAENKWIGVNCGIMDQLISGVGREGHAVLIDCRDLAVEPAPLPPDAAVVVLDTSTRRGLVDSQYNQRREQCAAAAAALGVTALRDVTPKRLQSAAAGLPPLVLRRARHVVGENDRTLRAAEAMRRGDSAELGRLMAESHRSLRDDYEVSCEALDVMVQCAAEHPACLGARMTGAGFGGCAVALVRAAAAAEFCRDVNENYRRRAGLTPAVYLCRAAAGAEAFCES